MAVETASASTGTVTASASPAASAAIIADGLQKRYGPVEAVSGVSFRVPLGQLVAFLGPNGAGKSTTMRMLTGYLAPTRGRAVIMGLDVQEDRVGVARKVGYLPENGPLYPDMSPVSTLRFLGRARGLDGSTLRERMDVVIRQCRLEEVAHRPAGQLSKGYRQRLGMAAALLHDPPVLILDEPTAGLDPNQVEQVRHVLKDLSRSRTVLLSTHILTEVRALADRILLINGGRLVHDGPGGSLGADEQAMEQRFRALTGSAPSGA